MAKLCNPRIVLATLLALLALLLIVEAMYLPNKVASHFDISGRPNGWMTREGHLLFSAVFSFAFPLMPVGLFKLMRFMPVQSINLSHKEYWLAEERREETYGWMVSHSLWFAVFSAGFALGLQLLLLWANFLVPKHLPGWPLLALTVVFLSCLVGWIVQMFRRFSQLPHRAAMTPPAARS